MAKEQKGGEKNRRERQEQEETVVTADGWVTKTGGDKE